MCFLNTNTFDNPLTADFQVRLITTMEEAIKTAVNKSKREWLWIYSDVCEYDDFDWNWVPDLDQCDQVHCWPSGMCEKGDTFLIHVPSFNSDDIKFNFEHESLQRKRWPVINVSHDSIALELNSTPRLNAIYTVYSYAGFVDYPDVCLWEKRPVVSINRSNSTCLVPRDCIVKNEIYEYPYLLRETDYGFDIFVEVIFIHNNESCAQENWFRCKVLRPDSKLLGGTNGRLQAYKSAASMSETPWFIAVFAKCQLLDIFKTLNWQPDYWQEPKHYIFNNRNLNNDLVYGHMAPIAYNKQLMLNNSGGLDMTLAQRHTTIPVCISETDLSFDVFLIWRTAFREVIKLIHYGNINPSIETQYRLHNWFNVHHGINSHWQVKAAHDAKDYYDVSGGREDALMLTSEWNWLKAYFDNLYKEEITV
jgi:hypothetical protein